MKKLMQLIIILFQSFKGLFMDAYMSTRISANEEFGWDIKNNIALASERQAMLEKKGIQVLNPADLYVKGWQGSDYMQVWRVVIRTMALFGKVMISFPEDLKGSQGCAEELALASEIGMKVIIIEE